MKGRGRSRRLTAAGSARWPLRGTTRQPRLPSSIPCLAKTAAPKSDSTTRFHCGRILLASTHLFASFARISGVARQRLCRYRCAKFDTSQARHCPRRPHEGAEAAPAIHRMPEGSSHVVLRPPVAPTQAQNTCGGRQQARSHRNRPKVRLHEGAKFESWARWCTLQPDPRGTKSPPETGDAKSYCTWAVPVNERRICVKEGSRVWPRGSEIDGILAPARVEGQERERARCQSNAYDAHGSGCVLFESGGCVAGRALTVTSADSVPQTTVSGDGKPY